MPAAPVRTPPQQLTAQSLRHFVVQTAKPPAIWRSPPPPSTRFPFSYHNLNHGTSIALNTPATPRHCAARFPFFHSPGFPMNATARTVLIVVLILMLLGTLPLWPYSMGWGYGPGGGLGLVVLILVILILTGKLLNPRRAGSHIVALCFATRFRIEEALHGRQKKSIPKQLSPAKHLIAAARTKDLRANIRPSSPTSSTVR